MGSTAIYYIITIIAAALLVTRAFWIEGWIAVDIAWRSGLGLGVCIAFICIWGLVFCGIYIFLCIFTDGELTFFGYK